jgi:uncharacterized protein YndB with AHSA1/START domain
MSPWTSFSQKIKIKATVKEVYDAWTTQESLEKWFLRLAEFKTSDGKLKSINAAIQKGDVYHWRWHGHPDSVEERGTILEANGKDKVKFEFGKAGIVSVLLSEEKGETLLEIKQEEIPTDDESKLNYYVGCSTGWTFFRANLKSFLEGGIDLRNKTSNSDLID